MTISDMLLRDLRKALTIVCTRAYADYRSYVQVRFYHAPVWYGMQMIRFSGVYGQWIVKHRY